MKQISLDAAKALMNRIPKSLGNTSIWERDGVFKMGLFGNEIAFLSPENVLSITNAGWFSNTTKDRLNALPNVNIYQRKGVWYLNDKEWDGSLTEINYL